MTKALELADYLDDLFDADGEPKQAAAMLRKQHAEIQEWRNVFGFLGTPDELGNEWNAMRETNIRQHDAIVKLREALANHFYSPSYAASQAVKQVLKDTKEFQ